MSDIYERNGFGEVVRYNCGRRFETRDASEYEDQLRSELDQAEQELATQSKAWEDAELRADKAEARVAELENYLSQDDQDWLRRFKQWKKEQGK